MAGKFKHSGGNQQAGGKDARHDEKMRQLKVSDPLIEQTRQPAGGRFQDGRTVPVDYPQKMLEWSKTVEPSPEAAEASSKPLPPPPARVQAPEIQKVPQKETAMATVNPQALQTALDGLTKAINDLGRRVGVVEQYHKTTLREWMTAKDAKLQQTEAGLGSLRQELEGLKQDAVNQEKLDSTIETVVDGVSGLVTEEVNKATDRFDADAKKLADELDRLKMSVREISSKHNELVDSWAELSQLRENFSEFEGALSNLLTNFESFLASIAYASNDIIKKIRNNGGSNE